MNVADKVPRSCQRESLSRVSLSHVCCLGLCQDIPAANPILHVARWLPGTHHVTEKKALVYLLEGSYVYGEGTSGPHGRSSPGRVDVSLLLFSLSDKIMGTHPTFRFRRPTNISLE